MLRLNFDFHRLKKSMTAVKSLSGTVGQWRCIAFEKTHLKKGDQS